MKICPNCGKPMEDQASFCPECGRTYVSGGLTRTKIMTPVDEKNPYNKSQKELFGEATTGNNADFSV